jgi:hypothetical protein
VSLSDSAETSLCKLLFEDTTWAGVATPVAGSVWIALFTSVPGDATAFGGESSYTNYARVEVARGSAGWSTAGTSPTTVSNDDEIAFPAAGVGGSETVSHAGICLTEDGVLAADLLAWSALDSSLSVSTGVIPAFSSGALKFTVD